MAGTQAGGRKAAATNKQRYGLTFYNQIGRKGGKISRGGGFAQNRELASVAGRKGGQASRRGVVRTPRPGEFYERPEGVFIKIRKRLARQA